jgi:16S rRNA C1402 (ribose-2'-O) methylase RsmI
MHEEVVRGRLSELAARYAQAPPRGECVLCVFCRASEKQETQPILKPRSALLCSGPRARRGAEAAALCGVREGSLCKSACIEQIASC